MRAKTRTFKVLFDNNLPFKHKVVERKDQYTRKTKHKRSHDDE